MNKNCFRFRVSLRTAFSYLLIPTLTACQTMPYVRIYSEDLFLEKIVSQSLSWPGGYDVRFEPNGEISGRFPNGAVAGSWEWRNEEFCRSIRVAGAPRPDECLQIEYNGDQVRFKRSNGGYFLPYRVTPSF